HTAPNRSKVNKIEIQAASAACFIFWGTSNAKIQRYHLQGIFHMHTQNCRLEKHWKWFGNEWERMTKD
ncbi:MAG: hypothetical protein IIY96_02030, partial [Lachnospiraceae bacterium]|nr:hypothetical protein [Lachnospiraceae bacterium]